MSEPTLDPRTDRLLDQRVRQARSQLREALGDVRPPPMRNRQIHREQRRMLVAAVAIAAVLAGSLAFLASGQESSLSTSDSPTPPAEEPSTATESSTTTRPTTTAAPTTTSAPAPEPTTTAAAAAEEPSPPPPGEPPPEDPRERLLGTTFAGTTVTESGHPRPLVDGTRITVAFEHNDSTGDDIVRWNAGCNTAGSPVAISADRLDVGPDGGSTAMGCPQARHDQDDWLGDFFHADPQWTLDDGTLTLTVADTVITLVEEPQA